MRDLITTDISSIVHVEQTFGRELESHGYELIRLPILEGTSLFSRGLGESTDAVSKEMFSLEDGRQSLSLRPEGTASCVRLINSNPHYRAGQPKLWYAGPMFRHERPQLGRYREFYQVGAEAFGLSGPDVDVEFLQIVQAVWQALGIEQEITLEINTLGNSESRVRHRDALVEFLTPLKEQLDEDSQRRLELNPLRILDSKNKQTQSLLADAPELADYLDDATKQYFDEFQARLQKVGIEATLNRRLVRGLDYYTHVVFEWNTERLGAQRQLGGGGRYDGLCELLGGQSRPAAGFAMGIDRVALLLEELQGSSRNTAPDVYVLGLTDAEEDVAESIAQKVRSGTNLRVRLHHGGGKAGARLRSADRSGSEVALIIGSEEAASEQVSVKWLRLDCDQSTIAVPELVPMLLNSTQFPPR